MYQRCYGVSWDTKKTEKAIIAIHGDENSASFAEREVGFDDYFTVSHIWHFGNYHF